MITLWIIFPGEGRIRGWLTAILIGDSKNGKTSISQGIFEFARLGPELDKTGAWPFKLTLKENSLWQ